MDTQEYYKQKYKKYKLKYLNYKKSLQNNSKNNLVMKGGDVSKSGDISIISSKTFGEIYVKKSNGSEPGYMKFKSDIGNFYQSMYNTNDLDRIYLEYVIPLLTFMQYTDMSKILFIGLGAGHIPMLLRSKFPNCHIDIVELDADVLTAAKIVGFEPDDKMNVMIGDGHEYIENSPIKDYNVVIIDLDAGDSFNKFNAQSVKKILNNDNGILAINFASGEENLSSKILEHFPHVKIYYIGQYIYIASKKDNKKMLETPLTIQTSSYYMKKLKYLDLIINKLKTYHTYILSK
ncbi:hypothetical protein QJ856_gp0755 [Tupanvirus deep ocean]|uniref:Uncharacterized protein n=2 Tax=Tupanvirus TaxID=2094720 RepID=A0AC62A891_9VIRU|nr:hypothetical protein QJ856_gp0755 [Tupanvirus deep ocean]QKU33997.1 hypothetical protein [Tupanvirus deep ocean]